MFGTTFQNAREVLHQFLTSYCCDDEGFIGIWPSISGFRHVIDTSFTIAHMSFYAQKEVKDLTLQKNQYNRLGELMLAHYGIPRTSDFERKLLSYSSIMVEGSLVKIDSRKSDPSGKTIYLIECCQRRPFASLQALSSRGYDTSQAIAISRDFMMTIPEGPAIE